MPRDPDSPRDGAQLPHVPVMPEEVLAFLDVQPGATVVDGTFGAGGHARLIAARMQGRGTYVGIDRDPAARARFDAFAAEVAPLDTRFVGGAFPDAMARLAADGVSADAVMLDVGVSSMQLDEPDRGFAYSHDAPLDMRMDTSGGIDAAELLASADARELERILREYGEEKWAARIAKRIVARREAGDPVVRTGQLVDVVLDSLPKGGRDQQGGHPAKRTFQALRIAVNEELDMLDRGLDAALELLAPDGRLLVLSFQSLEDRIVKRRVQLWAGSCTCPPGLPICVCGSVTVAEPLHRGVMRPGPDEVAVNPRAASTRLRAVRRIHPPRPTGQVDPGRTAS